MIAKRMNASALLVLSGLLLNLVALDGKAQERRSVLIPHPSWDCYLPQGIPAPEDGALIFEMKIPLDRIETVGRTPYGQRSVAVGLQGKVEGPRFSGAVMEGALDFMLTFPNGTIEIEQVFVLQAADGSYVYVRNAGTGPSAEDVRVVMDFEAPNASALAWMNSGTYVARRELRSSERTLILRVYDVSDVPVDTARATVIEKPADLPAQPWDYRRKAEGEQPGERLIEETVTLGQSQTVGESKRGGRNIIPITGGEVRGRINGKVLMGGADYQSLSPPATLDARYLWQTADGEIVIVRNGGTFGALVPAFETRVDGPYAYLNDGRYLSSNPSVGQGFVALTFYESAGDPTGE
ncbi:MAG: DUF3237 domain-containing protein [Gammaproteobacteria bacterium]